MICSCTKRYAAALILPYLYIITWLFLYRPEYVPCKHVFSRGPFTGQGTYEGQYKNNHVIMYLLYDIIII